MSRKRGDKIGIVYFFGNNRNPLMKTMFKLLGRFGFLKRKHPMSFILRNLSHEEEDSTYDVENWYASALWTEGLQI